MIKLYGIPNCNTVKKAKQWLLENEIPYQFHDFKKLGVPTLLLQNCCDKFGWEKVLNKSGLTYKKLSNEQKTAIHNSSLAMAYMQQNPSSIKRPILETRNLILIGFTSDEYHLNKNNMLQES